MWQVALVVRPSTSQPARAGFFWRERDGLIHASASYHEFRLESPRVLPRAADTERQVTPNADLAPTTRDPQPPPEPLVASTLARRVESGSQVIEPPRFLRNERPLQQD
jgi:hypothetical protein